MVPLRKAPIEMWGIENVAASVSKYQPSIPVTKESLRTPGIEGLTSIRAHPFRKRLMFPEAQSS